MANLHCLGEPNALSLQRLDVGKDVFIGAQQPGGDSTWLVGKPIEFRRSHQRVALGARSRPGGSRSSPALTRHRSVRVGFLASLHQ